MSLRIAIAEDDEPNRLLLVQLFETLGHTVVLAAADGNELVDGCRSNEIDVVFTDFNLPLMDGLAAAEHLAGMGIPVVMVSGHDDAGSIVVDHEPIEMVIRKPATVDQLQEAIRRVTSENWAQRKRRNL